MTWQVQGHTEGEWQHQYSQAGLSNPETLLKTTLPYFLPEQANCMALPHPISWSPVGPTPTSQVACVLKIIKKKKNSMSGLIPLFLFFFLETRMGPKSQAPSFAKVPAPTISF